jgi:hypothetical protein
MAGLYDLIETILLWGVVAFTLALVVYLGYLQYLKAKRRGARRRHHARRSIRHRTWRGVQRQQDDGSHSTVQQPSNT